jgi:hypothetical protein
MSDSDARVAQLGLEQFGAWPAGGLDADALLDSPAGRVARRLMPPIFADETVATALRTAVGVFESRIVRGYKPASGSFDNWAALNLSDICVQEGVRRRQQAVALAAADGAPAGADQLAGAVHSATLDMIQRVWFASPGADSDGRPRPSRASAWVASRAARSGWDLDPDVIDDIAYDYLAYRLAAGNALNTYDTSQVGNFGGWLKTNLERTTIDYMRQEGNRPRTIEFSVLQSGDPSGAVADTPTDDPGTDPPRGDDDDLRDRPATDDAPYRASLDDEAPEAILRRLILPRLVTDGQTLIVAKLANGIDLDRPDLAHLARERLTSWATHLATLALLGPAATEFHPPARLMPDALHDRFVALLDGLAIEPLTGVDGLAEGAVAGLQRHIRDQIAPRLGARSAPSPGALPKPLATAEPAVAEAVRRLARALMQCEVPAPGAPQSLLDELATALGAEAAQELNARRETNADTLHRKRTTIRREQTAIDKLCAERDAQPIGADRRAEIDDEIELRRGKIVRADAAIRALDCGVKKQVIGRLLGLDDKGISAAMSRTARALTQANSLARLERQKEAAVRDLWRELPKSTPRTGPPADAVESLIAALEALAAAECRPNVPRLRDRLGTATDGRFDRDGAGDAYLSAVATAPDPNRLGEAVIAVRGRILDRPAVATALGVPPAAVAAFEADYLAVLRALEGMARLG